MDTYSIGLGLDIHPLQDEQKHKPEITHPINSHLNFSLHRRSLGPYESGEFGDAVALVPHYRNSVEGEGFPFKNSTSLQDIKKAAVMQMPRTASGESQAPPLMYTDSPSLDASLTSLSDTSDSVLAPMPHPLGRNYAPPQLAIPPTRPRAKEEESFTKEELQFTRKDRLRNPSLLRTPKSVRLPSENNDANVQYTINGKKIYKPPVEWQRHVSDPKDGLILPGMPQLPIKPSKPLIVDDEFCDPWGRPECPPQKAIAIVASCVLFPPAWFLVSAGYLDSMCGVFPRSVKYASASLGVGSLIACIIIVVCLVAA